MAGQDHPDAKPRSQFHHCNDIVPTIYQVIGITPPRVVNGVPQDPIDGTSFAYTFDALDAPGRLKTQYFEIMGSRAIYHDEWMASAFGPRTPWIQGLPPGIKEWTPDQDVWELYHLDEDWTQANDLAAENPEKLAQLKETFAIEAARNSVYPVGGGLWIVVLHPEMRISTPYREWNFTGDITRMPEFCAPALGNRANQVTIDADIPEKPRGVLYALGGAGGGLTCYVDDGYLCYEYNLFIVMRTKIRSDRRLPAGPATIGIETVYAEPRPARPLTITMTVNGEPFGARAGPGQRTAAVHRQRLPRHRHLSRRARLDGLLRPGHLPLQRNHQHRQRPLHHLSAGGTDTGAVGIRACHPQPSDIAASQQLPNSSWHKTWILD